MTPIQAVILVAIFEFLGPILGGTAVANTIGKFIDLRTLADVTSLGIILAGVIGAIAWNLGTWWFGIPSSSSHALVGGLVGGGLAYLAVDGFRAATMNWQSFSQVGFASFVGKWRVSHLFSRWPGAQ